jgi:predicted secreted protein
LSFRIYSGPMLLAFLIVIFSFGSCIQAGKSVEPPATEWTQTFGGIDVDIARSLIQTSDGGYLVGGETSSFGAGDKDFWLVKVDSAGNHEWNQTYGGPNADILFSLVATSDGGYVLAGRTRSFGAGATDAWLVKIDASGNMEWNQTYGGPRVDVAHAVIPTTDGGYALAGYTTSFGADGQDLWLVKTDSSGSLEWRKQHGGVGDEDSRSIIETGDGGYALAGFTTSFGAGGEDFWLVKVDSAGNHEWNQTYGGANNDMVFSMVAVDDGGYALAGRTQSFGAGGRDFWLVKVDSAGNHEWNQTYGGASNDPAHSVVENNVITTNNGYALAGFTTSFGAGGQDGWLIKTDVNGTAEWNQTYGGSTNDVLNSLVTTTDGGYALAGFTTSFGAGGEDFWLVKVAPLEYTIIIHSNPTGVIFTVDSLLFTTSWNETYRDGTLINIEMPEVHTEGDARYYWGHWSDGNTSRSRTIILSTNTTLIANFDGPYYETTITSSPVTGVPFTVNGVPQSTPYDTWLIENDYVVEMPEACGGYVWSHWLEDGDPNRIKTIDLSGTETYTAIYVLPVGGSAVAVEYEYTAAWTTSIFFIVSFVAISGYFKRKYLQEQ